MKTFINHKGESLEVRALVVGGNASIVDVIENHVEALEVVARSATEFWYVRDELLYISRGEDIFSITLLHDGSQPLVQIYYEGSKEGCEGDWGSDQIPLSQLEEELRTLPNVYEGI